METFLFKDIPAEQREAMTLAGRAKLDWALRHMPVISIIGREIKKRESLKGKRIAMSLHPEAKTGVLALILARAGAEVRLVPCNPLSTDDEVSLGLMSLNQKGLVVRSRRGISREDYFQALNLALDMEPHILIDDGGDLVRIVHTERRDLLRTVLGGCEETTTGIIRLKALQAEGKLEFPMMDVNDCAMKHLFDNRYGTGQSTLDGIMASTNLNLAGMKCVVAGYGWCGRGIAMRLKGMGAIVTVSEVDPVKAVEAAMDGFRVLKLADACKDAKLIVTSTGCKDVVNKDILKMLPDGCILANAGHFNNEIDVASLRKSSNNTFTARRNVEGFDTVDGRTLFLISDGRLVNLAAGQGHPVEIMDMSFAIQAIGAEFIALHSKELPKEVIPFPRELDERIASIKLSSMGCSIDTLTKAQKKYLSSWEEGT